MNDDTPGLPSKEAELLTQYRQFEQLVAQHQHIGIISHRRPDGDAVGSTLALGFALQAQGKEVRLFNLEGMPERFAFLPGAELLETLPASFPPEMSLLICVDSGNPGRLGQRGEEFFAAAPATANIDHHATNTHYAGYNLVQGEAAACGCVLMQLFLALGWDISLPMATALYVAISTDTGSFQFGSTSPAVMRMAADLMERGVDVGEVNRLVYQEVSPEAITMTREVLNNMGFLAEGAVSYYCLSAARKAELGVGLEGTKDLVDIIRPIRGVKVAAIFEEVGGGIIRTSLRSKVDGVNVSDIALPFGGGGHAKAAGIPFRGTLEEASSQVLAAILAALPHD